MSEQVNSSCDLLESRYEVARRVGCHPKTIQRAAAQKRASMNSELRSESDWWQRTAPHFGFGIVQVEPIYSTGEAIRKYLTKQHWRPRTWPFKGMRVGNAIYSTLATIGRIAGYGTPVRIDISC